MNRVARQVFAAPMSQRSLLGRKESVMNSIGDFLEYFRWKSARRLSVNMNEIRQESRPGEIPRSAVLLIEIPHVAPTLDETIVKSHRASIVIEESTKLPSGSRRVWFDEMTRELVEYDFDERAASADISAQAKSAGKNWPHRAAFKEVKVSALGSEHRLFKFSFPVNYKDFFILFRVLGTDPVTAKLVATFEARSIGEIENAVRTRTR
jgi:hypothetical protein